MWAGTSNHEMRKERLLLFSVSLALFAAVLMVSDLEGADRKEEKKEPQQKCCPIGASAHEGRLTLGSICFSAAETVVHLEWKNGRACATPSDLHLYNQSGSRSDIRRTTGLPHCQQGKHPPMIEFIRFQWVFAPVPPGTTSIDIVEEGAPSMEGYTSFEFRGVDVRKCAQR